jgi:formate dehydrogenase subunit gamma
MNGAVGRVGENARSAARARGQEVRPGELLRHSLYTRIVHWTSAAFFILALLSGFAIYTPWFFHALTPLFGGGATTRLLHPWFGIGFCIAFTFQILNWSREMAWTADDSRWMGRIRDYVSNAETREPEYVGFFNAGQKAYFWTIAASVFLFLITGIPMWFPETFGRFATAISLVIHDITALVMLVGFIIHIYEGTAAQPGTFQSMTRGTVERRWAWTHHPAWYRRVSGDDKKP